MTAAVGRQRAARAAFVLGAWWQPVNLDQAAAELAVQRAAGVPVSVAQTYAHYLPLGGQIPADEQARTSALHDAGVAVTTYVNPMVGLSNPIYPAGLKSAAFTKNADGTPLVYHYSTAAEFVVSQVDFTSAAGRHLFDGVLNDTQRDGYDGWMEDFGEYTPDAAVASDATTGSALHNSYVVGYHATAKAYADAAHRPLARFNRSGWTGAIPESDIVWGGDPSTLWGFDGLQSAVRQGLSMGLSGVSSWGSDIGGFFTWPDDGLTPELLIRWIEFGAFSGVMRLQSGGISFGPPRAQVTDPAVAPVWKRYALLRTRLYPYLAGSNDAYQATGMPLMRQLALSYPQDAVATGLDDEYLFGADLLVAPVLTEGATGRSVYLPAGQWVDLWASIDMADDGAVTLGAATLRRGGGTVDVTAPIGQIPTQVRAGALIPLLPADVDTLADYGAEHLVTLAHRKDTREILAFPAVGKWSGPLGGGETMRSIASATSWILQVDAARPRAYTVQASLTAMPTHFIPASVRVDGKTVSFSYDAAARVVRFTADLGARGNVEVRG
jgi:alpha-glucosidase (family GH31 glycosyl hydrolase)